MAKRKHRQQIKDVQRRYKAKMEDIAQKQERVVTAILILIQSRAQYYTPQDTNALINSQYRQVRMEGGQAVGRVGYTQEYALWLHENDNWQPRPPNSKGKRGGGYNPNATSKYLIKGYQEERENIKRVIVDLNRL